MKMNKITYKLNLTLNLTSYEALVNSLIYLFNKQYNLLMSSNTKRRKTSDSMNGGGSPVKIGTHDGVFHCDEALACYMLQRLPEFRDAEIVRSRDPAKLEECDVVVDVGAVYDHSRKRYDHHQPEFKETLSSLHPELGNKFSIKLSSAGLIYSHYGERVLKTFIWGNDNPVSSSDLKLVYKKIYENLIEEIDAIDNGVPITDSKPNYEIHTHLSARVARLNPDWNSKTKNDRQNIFVNKALFLVGEEFEQAVNYFLKVWLPARAFVKTAIEERIDIHSSGEIIELKERVPWKNHLFDLEEEYNIGDKIKFVIFYDKPHSWRVQAVPVSPNSFITRKPLPENWWGQRDEELSKRAIIDGCIFVHANGFIGGNKTREGALKMAVVSLEGAVKMPEGSLEDAVKMADASLAEDGEVEEGEIKPA